MFRIEMRAGNAARNSATNWNPTSETNGIGPMIMVPTVRVDGWEGLGALVLWCFVLNPHRRSPYPNSQLELRDKLRVSSPVRAIGTNRVLLLPPLLWYSKAPTLFAFFFRLSPLIVTAALLLPPSPLRPPKNLVKNTR